MNNQSNLPPEGPAPADENVKAQAVHLQPSSDIHATHINALRVLLVRDDGGWFAQGLELDYAASGHSVEDVKHRFVQGLGATIKEHLKTHGAIERLLKVSPQDVWDLWLNADRNFSISTMSWHDMSEAVEAAAGLLPFQSVAYLEPAY